MIVMTLSCDVSSIFTLVWMDSKKVLQGTHRHPGEQLPGGTKSVPTIVSGGTPPRQFMGALTDCKTWYENGFQVSFETWPQTLVFVPGFAGLFFGKLEIPT